MSSQWVGEVNIRGDQSELAYRNFKDDEQLGTHSEADADFLSADGANIQKFTSQIPPRLDSLEVQSDRPKFSKQHALRSPDNNTHANSRTAAGTSARDSHSFSHRDEV